MFVTQEEVLSMKKKIICLLLCLCAVLPLVLTACGQDGNASQSKNTYVHFTDDTAAVTVVLYSICNEGTTDEAIARVQTALNEISEAQYKTHIELRLFPEAKYYNVLKEKMAQIQADETLKERLAAAQAAAARQVKSANVTTSPDLANDQIDIGTVDGDDTQETTAYTPETKKNELGFTETVYPEADPNQLDIFLINNADFYQEYVDSGLLADLSGELNVGSSILKSYINSDLLSAVTTSDGTFAVPNNHIIGEYEYILINRELADKYYIDCNSIAAMSDLTDYFDLVIKHEPQYIPMVNYGSELTYFIDNKPTMLGTWLKPSDFSAVGTSAFLDRLSPMLLFSYRDFNQYYITKYKYKNYIRYMDSIDGVENVAAAVVKGGLELAQKYEEQYYVIPYKTPILYNEDVFSSVYAVSKYAVTTSRCMEVLELLTMNEEFRNIFQYGVNEIDYTRDSDGVVHRISNDYNMNALYTGNMFKLWQSDDMTAEQLLLSADNWALAKKQNREAELDPFLGFTLEEDPDVLKGERPVKSTKTDAEGNQIPVSYYCSIADIMKKYDELYADFLARYEAFEPYDDDGMMVDIDYFITALAREYSQYDEVKDSIAEDYNSSVKNQVKDWYRTKYNIREG